MFQGKLNFGFQAAHKNLKKNKKNFNLNLDISKICAILYNIAR